MIPALNSKMGTLGCQSQYSTFSMGKKAKQIDPLLFLKIIVPFALPLAGFLLPPLFPISNPSETDSYNSFIQEEEDEIDEENEEEEQQQMDSLVLASRTEFIARNVISREHVEEETSLREEIERLNNRVSDVEDRESQIQLEFSEYCNMKKYESLVEKLQIMCLGLKTEHLEKQNQSLEETIAKLMDEKAVFETMRGEIKRLKKHLTKISEGFEHNLQTIHQRLQEYEAKEARLLKRNQELEMTIRDAKDMIEMKKNCNSEVMEVKELTIEQGRFNLTQNEDVLNQTDRIRSEWAADMEEMIYLAWITISLRHEISMINQMEETKHEPKLEKNVTFDATDPIPMSTETTREETMKVLVKSEEVQQCNEDIQPKPPVECANSITNPDENCMDVMVRKNGFNMGKPKLINKVKRWAKGKGKCS